MVSSSKRILIFTDSLGATRHDDRPGGYYYDSTYSFKIMNSPDVLCYHYGVRGGLSKNFINQQIIFDYLEGFQPNVVILHFGINDAAPRLFPYYMNRVMNRLSRLDLLEALIKSFINFSSKNRYWITRMFKWVYTKPRVFERNINATIEEATKLESKPRIIFVGILMPSKSLCERSYGFKENVKKYNSIIQRVIEKHDAEFIDPNMLMGPITNSDGIHLSAYGHDLIFRTISKML